MARETAYGHAILIGFLALTSSACGSEDETGGKIPEKSPGRFPGGTDPLPPLSPDVALPIVFVHGFAGSAQQYQSQAIRFVANGYPQERIRPFDHDGQGGDIAGYATGVDGVVDAALTEFSAKKVYLVGHSRGTSVSSTYLGDAQRAAKVAKYISLDGYGCDAANAAGVPCIAPTQATLPGQKHVEVATSAESFVVQYEFLVGKPPTVVDIVPQAEPVEISGRAVNFPQNTGRDGATLEIWEIDSKTGTRLTTKPHATFQIGPDGEWGPAVVLPDKYYEQVLTTPQGSSQHIYAQRYLRSTHFVRLLSGPPDAPTRVNTNMSDKHAALIALRMREWLTSDILEIGTASASDNQTTVNAIKSTLGGNANFAPIAIHIHDAAASPGDSTLEPLDWFSTQPFQTGVDVFMPAADPPDGTITVTNMPRGDTSKPQILNVPNWASSNHTIMAMFSDYAQD